MTAYLRRKLTPSIWKSISLPPVRYEGWSFVGRKVFSDRGLSNTAMPASPSVTVASKEDPVPELTVHLRGAQTRNDHVRLTCGEERLVRRDILCVAVLAFRRWHVDRRC